MLRRPSRMPGQEWSLLLNNNSEDYVVPAADLAPFDPRTQDPNIAPWADIEQEDEEIQVILLLSSTLSYLSHGCSPPVPPCLRQALPPTTPTGKRAPSKGSSFSLATGGLFGRQPRNNDAQDAQSIAGGDSKKSFLNIKGLRRKNSKASLGKEPSFSGTPFSFLHHQPGINLDHSSPYPTCSANSRKPHNTIRINSEASPITPHHSG
jgi:hypothetical protein